MYSHRYFSILLLSVILGLLLFNAIIMQDTQSRILNGSSSNESSKEGPFNSYDPHCTKYNQATDINHSNYHSFNLSKYISLCYPSNSNWIKNHISPTNWTDINEKFEGWDNFATNEYVTAFLINSSSISLISDTNIPPTAGVYINNFTLVDPPFDSLHSYIEMTIWGMKNKPSYTEIGVNVTDNPINPTYMIFYKYKNNITNTDYKVVDAIFVVQNDIYEILYQATESEFSNYLPDYKKILKFCFIGFSIIFILILFVLAIHDTMTGQTSNVVKHYEKYGFLASPKY